MVVQVPTQFALDARHQLAWELYRIKYKRELASASAWHVARGEPPVDGLEDMAAALDSEFIVHEGDGTEDDAPIFLGELLCHTLGGHEYLQRVTELLDAVMARLDPEEIPESALGWSLDAWAEKTHSKWGATPRIRLRSGYINNCAVANGYTAAECQVCQGVCPDEALNPRR